MASMTILGLSQILLGPTHEKAHMLDLLFCSEWIARDLIKGLEVWALSWSVGSRHLFI